MAFADLESKLDEAREGSSNGGNSNDYDELPRVKLTPTAAIGGTIVDVGFTGDPYEEQNYKGGEGYGGDFVFTIEDPEVVRGRLFEALGRTEAEDNLVRNLDGDDYYPFDVDRYTGGPTSSFRVVDEEGSDASHIGELVKSSMATTTRLASLRSEPSSPRSRPPSTTHSTSTTASRCTSVGRRGG